MLFKTKTKSIFRKVSLFGLIFTVIFSLSFSVSFTVHAQQDEPVVEEEIIEEVIQETEEESTEEVTEEEGEEVVEETIEGPEVLDNEETQLEEEASEEGESEEQEEVTEEENLSQSAILYPSPIETHELEEEEVQDVRLEICIWLGDHSTVYQGTPMPVEVKNDLDETVASADIVGCKIFTNIEAGSYTAEIELLEGWLLSEGSNSKGFVYSNDDVHHINFFVEREGVSEDRVEICVWMGDLESIYNGEAFASELRIFEGEVVLTPSLTGCSIFEDLDPNTYEVEIDLIEGWEVSDEGNNPQLFVYDGEGVTHINLFVEEAEILEDTFEVSGTVRDFMQSHPDFQYKIAFDDGIVEDQLGDDGKPVYAPGEDGTTPTTNGKEFFDQWYNDVDGINMSLPLVLTFDRTITDDEFVYSTVDGNPFFPIDNMLFGNEGFNHNYHFTYEFNGKFLHETDAEQFLSVSADDDFWIFINDELVLDLGGVHAPIARTINLNDLGLEEGENEIAIFFAERHSVESSIYIDLNFIIFQDDDSTDPDPETPACDDGVDNDNDGLIDLEDADCENADDDDESGTDGDRNPECMDGIDNDEDGQTDLDDEDCDDSDDNNEGDDTNPDPDPETPACDDGMDNDGDGWIDLDDADCLDSNDDNENDEDGNSDNNPACSDGIDNDGDELVDADDPDCENGSDGDEGDDDNGNGDGGNGGDEGNGGDNNVGSAVTPVCRDGIDNDNDGLVDLDDPDCENEDDTDEDDQGGITGGGYRIGGGSGGGQVLGAATGGGSCEASYFNEFVMNGIGSVASPEAVVKIQAFLNDYQDAGLTLTGVYDADTIAAVKDFQIANAEEVLTPWGITEATGHVYETTLRAMNMERCGMLGQDLSLPLPTPLVPFQG